MYDTSKPSASSFMFVCHSSIADCSSSVELLIILVNCWQFTFGYVSRSDVENDEQMNISVNEIASIINIPSDA